MSDSALLAASVKTALEEAAKQAYTLGNGLQNAAPSEKAGSPNQSVSYLLTISQHLYQTANEIDKSIT